MNKQKIEKNIQLRDENCCDAKRKARIRRSAELLRYVDLPESSAKDLPCICLKGDDTLTVENYTGVLEIGNRMIRLYTGLGILRICGDGLGIRDADMDMALISGRICSISYENR